MFRIKVYFSGSSLSTRCSITRHGVLVMNSELGFRHASWVAKSIHRNTIETSKNCSKMLFFSTTEFLSSKNSQKFMCWHVSQAVNIRSKEHTGSMPDWYIITAFSCLRRLKEFRRGKWRWHHNLSWWVIGTCKILLHSKSTFRSESSTTLLYHFTRCLWHDHLNTNRLTIIQNVMRMTCNRWKYYINSRIRTRVRT